MKHVTVGQSSMESKRHREAFWHINVDFLQDRLHIDVYIFKKTQSEDSGKTEQLRTNRIICAQIKVKCNKKDKAHWMPVQGNHGQNTGTHCSRQLSELSLQGVCDALGHNMNWEHAVLF